MTKSIKGMSLETQENYDKLMTYLMNYAIFEHKIGVEFTDKLPSFAPPRHKEFFYMKKTLLKKLALISVGLILRGENYA